MTRLEVLKKARALISKPENWCKGTTALDERGQNVSSDSDFACRWCMWGSLRRIDPSDTHLYAISRLLNAETCRRTGITSHISFNDLPETTHEQVLEVMDAAIEKLVSREGEASG
jgi:hypothetical protein